VDFLNQQNQFKIMPENTISPYAYPQRTYYSPLAKPLKRSHSFHGLDIQIAPPQFIPGALANRCKRALAIHLGDGLLECVLHAVLRHDRHSIF